MPQTGSYYTGNTIDRTDADNHFATWTADELIELREYWRLFTLHDIAIELGRTEAACQAMYSKQMARPMGERFTPAQHVRRAWGGPDERALSDSPPDGGVRSIHSDEDLWWQPDYYRAS